MKLNNVKHLYYHAGDILTKEETTRTIQKQADWLTVGELDETELKSLGAYTGKAVTYTRRTEEKILLTGSKQLDGTWSHFEANVLTELTHYEITWTRHDIAQIRVVMYQGKPIGTVRFVANRYTWKTHHSSGTCDFYREAIRACFESIFYPARHAQHMPTTVLPLLDTYKRVPHVHGFVNPNPNGTGHEVAERKTKRTTKKQTVRK